MRSRREGGLLMIQVPLYLTVQGSPEMKESRPYHTRLPLAFGRTSRNGHVEPQKRDNYCTPPVQILDATLNRTSKKRAISASRGKEVRCSWAFRRSAAERIRNNYASQARNLDLALAILRIKSFKGFPCRSAAEMMRDRATAVRRFRKPD